MPFHSVFGAAADPLVKAAGISGLSSAFGQAVANKANKQASLRQMQFQKEMSSTAYQRAMADMRKAGLNPILAYKQGGASSPAGSTYQAGNIGLAAAQGAQAFSSANQMQIDAGIAETTLQMLKKNKISMAEVQYTFKNVFQSKLFRTVEAALGGTVEDAPTGVYREIAAKIKEFLTDHQDAFSHHYGEDDEWNRPIYGRTPPKQFISKDGKSFEPTLQLSGRALQELLAKIPTWAAEVGLDAAQIFAGNSWGLIMQGANQ